APPGTPGLPEEAHVVEHIFVPARVLADHPLGRLRDVHQLEQRERPDQDPARAEGVAERGVFRGAGDREEPDGLERVEAHELVVTEANLRAPEAELEHPPRQAREPRRPRHEPPEPRDAPPRAGSAWPSRSARKSSGRRAQFSWWAFRPSPGIASCESCFCCHGGSSARKRRTSSAVDASIRGWGACSSASLVTTTTWSLPCGSRQTN